MKKRKNVKTPRRGKYKANEPTYFQERERERERENGSLPRPELEILRVNNYYFVARTLSFCPLPQTHSLEFTVLTVVLMEGKQRGERWKGNKDEKDGREKRVEERK